MRIVHVNAYENRDDEGFLPKTNEGTIFLPVDLNDEELAFLAAIGDHARCQEPVRNVDRSICSVFEVHHGDAVKYTTASDYHHCRD